MSVERIEKELAILRDGQQEATLIQNGQAFVIYHQVPTGGSSRGLPAVTDVIVPVPGGYPAAMIDLAGLPLDSPLLSRVKGGSNNQGEVEVQGIRWRLCSYHPHNGGGGPPWDQTRHGFHTYLDHLISWLDRLD